MELTASSEHIQMRDTLRALLAEHAPLSRLHRPSAVDDAALWPVLGASGWLGATLDEAQGGLGLGAVEAVILAEECGRALVSPAFAGILLALPLLAAAGHEVLVQTMLAGGQPIGLGIPRTGAEMLLIGAPDNAPFCVWSEHGIAVHSDTALRDRRKLNPLDETLSLQAGQFAADDALAQDPDVRRPDLLIAAMLAGLAWRAVEVTTAYAKLREQFGHPIGSFQAVKHRCADMLVAATAASAQTLYAAVSLDDGLEGAGSEILAARLVCAEAATANAAACVQVHGGIGYTADADAHLFVKRAQILSRLGGDNISFERRILAKQL